MEKEKAEFSNLSRMGFIAYSRQLIAQLRRSHVAVADKYRTSLNKFQAFYGDRELQFSDITPTLMVEFEHWMKGSVSRNTSSFYLRNLHAIYNRAADDGLVVKGINPFLRVYTGVDKTRKRAMSLNDIKRIKNYDLTGNPKMAFARDMFMFSFYTRGMSFIDIAYLKTTNIKGGNLVYHRSKTSQTLSVKWMPEMDDIVRRYSSQCTSGYLLPLLSEDDYDKSRRQYDSAGHRINRQLKKLGELLHLPFPLTMYVARHSWATAAQTNNISLSVISQSLGHDSERTTRIYLASINSFEIDNANEKILHSLLE